jgi:hypothetical protein
MRVFFQCRAPGGLPICTAAHPDSRNSRLAQADVMLLCMKLSLLDCVSTINAVVLKKARAIA